MNWQRIAQVTNRTSLETASAHLTNGTFGPRRAWWGKACVLVVVLMGWAALAAPCTARADETWRQGEVFSDNDSGALQLNGAFLSNGLVPRIAVFQPPATKKKIRTIRLTIVKRSGSYDSPFTVVFEVRDFDGNIKRTVSASAVDLKTSPRGEWISVPLSKEATDRIIEPGEYLAVHVVRGGDQGGDLQVDPIFEAVVH